MSSPSRSPGFYCVGPSSGVWWVLWKSGPCRDSVFVNRVLQFYPDSNSCPVCPVGPGERPSLAPALSPGLDGGEGGCHQEMAWFLGDQHRDEPGTPQWDSEVKGKCDHRRREPAAVPAGPCQEGGQPTSRQSRAGQG